MTNDMTNEEPIVDDGLLAWFAELTPDARLRWLQDFVDDVLKVRAENGLPLEHDELP